MSNVTITPIKNAVGGTLINQFPNSADKGYIKVEQNSLEFGKGWAKTLTRTALIKGDFPTLEAIIRSAGPKKELPGRIVVQEFVQSEVPEQLKRDFYNQNAEDEEEALAPYVKKAGSDEDALELTVGGERILRFASYDPTGTGVDIKVAHDNGAEVSAQRVSERNRVAVLPAGGEK